jgi:hypothetical protein
MLTKTNLYQWFRLVRVSVTNKHQNQRKMQTQKNALGSHVAVLRPGALFATIVPPLFGIT